YVEGWHVIAEANRIFGYDAWDRQTITTHCVWSGKPSHQVKRMSLRLKPLKPMQRRERLQPLATHLGSRCTTVNWQACAIVRQSARHLTETVGCYVQRKAIRASISQRSLRKLSKLR